MTTQFSALTAATARMDTDQIAAARGATTVRMALSVLLAGLTGDQSGADIVTLLEALSGNGRLNASALRLIADALDTELGNADWRTGGGGGSDTAAQILAKLLTVDGAGSGLDADLLDGMTPAEVAALGGGGSADGTVDALTLALAAGVLTATVGLTVGNDVASAGLDLGAIFARLAAANTFTEALTVGSPSGGPLTVQGENAGNSTIMKIFTPDSGTQKAFGAGREGEFDWVQFAGEVVTGKPGFALGPGTARDTNLYREEANHLKTDDAFTAAGDMTTEGDLTAVGGTFTAVVSGVAPTADAHLATKEYVDSMSGGGGASSFAELTGEIADGQVPATFTRDVELAAYAALSGATFTNEVQGVTPTNDAGFTTKAYVDAAVAGTTPPTPQQEQIYYGQIGAAADAATVDVSTLTAEDATVAGHDFSIGPAVDGQFFVILVPANHDLLTLVNTHFNTDVLSTYVRATNVRQLGTPTEAYNAYTHGPLNAGITVAYRATLTE